MLVGSYESRSFRTFCIMAEQSGVVSASYPEISPSCHDAAQGPALGVAVS